MVNDFVPPSFDKRLSDSRRQIVEHLVPAHTLPFSLAALAGALERIEYSLRVAHLVDRRGTLGAVAATTAGMLGIAFEFANLESIPVNVGEQAASRFAVETYRRDDRIAALDLPRPMRRIQLDPIFPLRRRRIASQSVRRRIEILRGRIQRLRVITHCNSLYLTQCNGLPGFYPYRLEYPYACKCAYASQHCLLRQVARVKPSDQDR